MIAFAPLGTEKAVLNTIANAVNKEIQVIALTGANNDAIQGVLAEADLEISIPATKESRILENHYSSLMHCVSLLIARFSQELDIKGFSNQTISKIN